METKTESQDLWNMLCGGQVSPKEVPFPTQQDAQDYLNKLIGNSLCIFISTSNNAPSILRVLEVDNCMFKLTFTIIFVILI